MTRTFLLIALLAATAGVAADEGMWTTHTFPRAEVLRKYGVSIDDAWLQKLQRSVVRLESGCTGSFVSPDGLILTNHHCAESCLSENSTAARDLVAGGFVSPDRAEEVRCQGVSHFSPDRHGRHHAAATQAPIAAASGGGRRALQARSTPNLARIMPPKACWRRRPSRCNARP